MALLPSHLLMPDLNDGWLVEAPPGMAFAVLATFAAYPRHSVNLANVVLLLDALRSGLPGHLVQVPRVVGHQRARLGFISPTVGSIAFQDVTFGDRATSRDSATAPGPPYRLSELSDGA